SAVWLSPPPRVGSARGSASCWVTSAEYPAIVSWTSMAPFPFPRLHPSMLNFSPCIGQSCSVINAVIFDLDGVLIDSEPVWEQVRRQFVADHGGVWLPEAQGSIMGMSTQEWARYLSEDLGTGLPPDRVADGVIDQMAARYRERLPLMPDAVAAVRRLAARWPLGLGSSAPASLIESVLVTAGLRQEFAVVMSTEQVPRGKPAPDIYLNVTARLGVPPGECAAIEDSTNGLRSAAAAGLALVAVPHPRYPPDPAALARAKLVLTDLTGLTAATITALG